MAQLYMNYDICNTIDLIVGMYFVFDRRKGEVEGEKSTSSAAVESSGGSRKSLPSARHDLV
jgi:hypothetical protein